MWPSFSQENKVVAKKKVPMKLGVASCSNMSIHFAQANQNVLSRDIVGGTLVSSIVKLKLQRIRETKNPIIRMYLRWKYRYWIEREQSIKW